MPAVRLPAKDRALRLLAVRSRSREELRRRLVRAGFEAEEVAAALDDLEAVGLVDDDRFARELAAHHLERRGSGRRAALAALRRAGVGAPVAEEALSELDRGDEEARAEALARTRASRLTRLDPETAFRRLVSFLVRRGYEGTTARTASRRALGESVGED